MISPQDNLEQGPTGDLAGNAASREVVYSLLRLLRIARHKRKTLFYALGVAVVLGAAYYVLAPRYFESCAKLLIVQRNNDQVPTMADQVLSDNTMATHQELVTSPVVVQDAMEQMLPEHRIDFQDQPPQKWNKVFKDHLSAKGTRKTNIIEVRYQSLDPEAAAAAVSAVIQAYLAFVERTHQGSASEVIRILTTERDQLQRSLGAKQQELQSFRQTKGQLAIKSDGKVVDPMIQRALRLNDALMTTQEKRIDLQATLATVELAVGNSANLSQHLAAIERVLGKEMLASALGFSPQDITMIHEQEAELLKVRSELNSATPYYGPAHPRVAELTERAQSIEHFLTQFRGNTEQRIASLSNAHMGPTLANMLRQEVVEAQRKEQQLLDSFNLARTEAAHQSGEIVQLEMLEREVERLERLHDLLFNKIATVDINQLQGPIQATVVQEPLPDELPVWPQLRHVAIFALLSAVVVGGLIAYVEDILEDRFTSPEDITSQLGAPVLAMVRQLDSLEGKGLDTIHTFVMPTAAETETFRTLRTALTLQSEPADRILISSSEPGDGKTTVSANLAVSFAQSGKKTLVIDADLRKPGMTTLLDLKGQPGVADILAGDESIDQIAPRLIHKTDQERLDVLPAGLRRPNPAELLGGSRFVELLAWADSRYDQVLVDCPPVLAVSDAQVIGRLIDGAILVVRPEKNHRRLVTKAYESFRSTGSHVLGIVANGLSVESRGYGYGYGYGYGHDLDEDVANNDVAGSDENENDYSVPMYPAGESSTARRHRAA